MKIILIVLGIVVLASITLVIIFWPRSSASDDHKPHKPKYNGLVLFDIDGTLAIGHQDNQKIVQTCLDKGFAVGICTAGGIYTMENLKNRSWMPHNLWQFIRDHNDITFNNVSSGMLMGKMNRAAYSALKVPSHTDMYGYRKGFALAKTGEALDVTCMVLCDDNRGFIDGIKTYGKQHKLNFVVVCGGRDCGGRLSVAAVQKGLASCSA